jgi:hypothetical protein
MARFPTWREKPYYDVLKGWLNVEHDDEGNLKDVARRAELAAVDATATAAEAGLTAKADKVDLALDHARYAGDTLYIDPDGNAMWRPLAEILAGAPISTDRYGYGEFDTGPMPE